MRASQIFLWSAMPSRFIRAYRVTNARDAIAKHVAYNARSQVASAHRKKPFDFSKRKDHRAGGLICPAMFGPVPADPAEVWLRMQAAVRPNTGTIATALVATLPEEGELRESERIALIEAFCEPIRAQGHFIRWDIHRGPRKNWHVHLLVSYCGMRTDGSIVELPKSPFRTSFRAIDGKPNPFTPPWQRLWRVIQDRFFLERGIALRVPASTMRIGSTSGNSAQSVRPASPSGYASSQQIRNWLAHRSALFSDRANYLAALTRDRLLLDQRDIIAFDTMIWADKGPPPQIAELFEEVPQDHQGAQGGAKEPQGLRLDSGIFASSESRSLLENAVASIKKLSSTSFMEQSEIDAVPTIDGAILAGASAITVLSATDCSHIMRFEAPPNHYLGALATLLDFHDLDPPHRRVAVFVMPDHVAYARYADQLREENFVVVSLTEFLAGDLIQTLSERHRVDIDSLVVTVLDIQRITERNLARVICHADAMCANVAAFKLLLLKPRDRMAEPIMPLHDWIARTVRHYFVPDRISRADFSRFQDDRSSLFSRSDPDRLSNRSIIVQRTRHARLVAYQALDSLPAPIGRRQRYAAMCRFLQEAGYIEEPRDDDQRHPLVLVGSAEAAGLLPDCSDMGEADAQTATRSIGPYQLQEGDRAVITATMTTNDGNIEAGSVVEIVETRPDRDLLHCSLPGKDAALILTAEQAKNVVPLDIIPAREAYLVTRHIDAIRKTLACDVYVVVTEAEHAEKLIALAEPVFEDLMQIVVDTSICGSRDELVHLIDRRPFADFMEALSVRLDAPLSKPEPNRSASAPDDFPVPADKMNEPAHDAGHSSLDMDFEFDFLPDEPDPAVAPQRRRMPHQPSTSPRIAADELDHEDDPDVDQTQERAYADDPDDYEDDPDPRDPGDMDEDHDPKR